MHAGKGVARPLPSLDLVGDGHEIGAVSAVERAFGVALDYRNARNWHSAGDVYQALLDALSDEPIGAWRRFSHALASENGVDPEGIFPETLLLGPGIPLVTAVKRLFDRGRSLG